MRLTNNISKSALLDYINCPHHYHEARIKKTKPANTVDVSALVRGIAVHNAAELMAKGEFTNEYCSEDERIKTIFLDAVSSQITRGMIKIDNYHELNNEFYDYDIYDQDETRYLKYKISWEYYRSMEYEFKDKLDGAFEKLPAFIDLLKDEMADSKRLGEKVEITQNTAFPLTKDQEVHITSIFDSVYQMNFDDVIHVNENLPEEEGLITDYEKMLKPGLIKICEENQIEILPKDTKRKLAEKIVSKLYDRIIEEKKAEIKELEDEQREILKKCEYDENGKIHVIREYKTGERKATLDDARGLMDAYIYSAIYYQKTGVIPVFQIVRLVVTKTKKEVQKFNLFLTIESLIDWYEKFQREVKNIFIDKSFPKNTLNNWKCSPARCEYYEKCQKNTTFAYKVA